MPAQLKAATHVRIYVLALVCFALQIFLAPNIMLGAGQINFALIFVGLVSFTHSRKAAIISGFLGGIVFELLGASVIGIMPCLLSIVGYVLASDVRARIQEDPLFSFIVFGVCSFAVSCLHFIVLLILGTQPSILEALVFRMLPVFVLTTFAFIPFVVVLQRMSAPKTSMSLKHGQKKARHSYLLRR